MTVFFEFIDQNARYIYLLIALIALYLLYRAVKTRRERRAAIFPLEKEVAELTIRRLFGFAILLALLMAGTWAITERFLPGLESNPSFATPTPDLVLLIATPTPTPPPPTA
ncbi:MAG: hypothetical protein GXP42_17610, partial [Chloroflexi bacterium]|nr:hypothetical protein [Chloroflexota bacterium]